MGISYVYCRHRFFLKLFSNQNLRFIVAIYLLPLILMVSYVTWVSIDLYLLAGNSDCVAADRNKVKGLPNEKHIAHDSLKTVNETLYHSVITLERVGLVF
jgi:hypothetical protein